MKKTNHFSFFCEKIKFIRKEAGLTQKEMAHIMGVGITTLSKIERGDLPSRLSCSVLFRIQQHFGIHPKDLFTPSVSNDLNIEKP